MWGTINRILHALLTYLYNNMPGVSRKSSEDREDREDIRRLMKIASLHIWRVK